MGQRLKVLISAYACRPGEGSEPSIGWETVRQVVKYHDVWLLTRANNQPSLNAELAQRPLPGLQVIYLDLPAWARWWNYKQIGVQLHYYIWQILGFFVAYPLHRKISFDLVHHVTYVKYWSPSFLALLPIPFIWGPVGGGEECPASFRSTFSWRGRLTETARDVARWLAERDPFVLITARRSAIARGTTQETAACLEKLGAKTVQIYSQVGMSPEQLSELAHCKTSSASPIRFISVGRLLPWKGFHLGLQAFALAKSQLPDSAEYWLVGDGVERQRLQDLAEKLGIRDKVYFKGKLSRQETLQCVGDCLALVHPSLHESGGMVCLEAMAAGCPVICLELGGPAVQVTSKTGIKVSAIVPEQSVQELAEAMVFLASNPEQRLQLGQAGQHHAQEHYSWERKGEELSSLYQSVIAQSQRDVHCVLERS